MCLRDRKECPQNAARPLNKGLGTGNILQKCTVHQIMWNLLFSSATVFNTLFLSLYLSKLGGQSHTEAKGFLH